MYNFYKNFITIIIKLFQNELSLMGAKEKC